jgi:hypothetical protein
MRVMRWAATAAGMGMVVAAALVGQASAEEDRSQFAEVRKATAQYHNEAKAVAAGYTPTDECVPGMGYHYVNYELFGAPLDPLKPAALIYAPHGKDARKLIAVEYFVVDEDQDPATHNSTMPSMFGQTFDGPMPGHGHGMPVHYDLHAYIWTTNPNGTLATWNPEVTCPED